MDGWISRLIRGWSCWQFCSISPKVRWSAGLLDYERQQQETGVSFREYFPVLAEKFIEVVEEDQTASSEEIGK
ncbi:MAG TPA: hypothetical protein PKI15_05805 [Candidatus Cloacimonadota bacterium]|nr:hypothetical protein [Candidatus Cloacimonadota bacterium]